MLKAKLFVCVLLGLQHLTTGSLLYFDDGETSLCQPLWDEKRVNEAGKLCIEAEPTNSQHVVVTYTTKKDWVLQKVYFWMGSHSEKKPQNTNDRSPILQNFPYKNDKLGNSYNYSFRLPLNDTGIFCPTPSYGHALVVVSHVVLETMTKQHRIDVAERTGWEQEEKPKINSNLLLAGANQDNNNVLPWTEFEFSLSCSDMARGNLSTSRNLEAYINASQCLNVTEAEAKALGMEHYLTKDFVEKTRFFSNISLYTIFYDEIRDVELQRTRYERYSVWEDDADDLHVLIKKEGVCYGIFRGSQRGVVWDWGQNVFMDARRVSGSNCYVRSGAYSAYFTDFIDEFRSEVLGCVESCDDGCELVLGGVSQGAQAAYVAALDLRALDPEVILIGAPKTVYPRKMSTPFNDVECTDLDNLRITRLTFLQLQREFEGKTFYEHYDSMDFDFGFGATHWGYHIIIDTNGLAVNVGKPGTTVRRPKMGIFHRKEDLWEWIQTFASQPCIPVSTSGWPNGHWCSKYDECVSGRCHDSACRERLTSRARCESDRDCLFGECHRGGCR